MSKSTLVNCKEYIKLKATVAGCCRGYTLPDNDSRTEVKVLLYNVKQLPLTLIGGSIVEDRNGEGVGNSNGIGHLIQHTYMYYIKNNTFS